MDDGFEELKKVVDEVFHRSMQKTDGMIELDRLSSLEKVVVLTFHVFGLAIGMGLEDMLEDEMDADPDYAMTIDAFKKIGAFEIASIIEEGIERRDLIRTGQSPKGLRDFAALDSDFYARERECVILLGRYVLANSV